MDFEKLIAVGNKVATLLPMLAGSPALAIALGLGRDMAQMLADARQVVSTGDAVRAAELADQIEARVLEHEGRTFDALDRAAKED